MSLILWSINLSKKLKNQIFRLFGYYIKPKLYYFVYLQNKREFYSNNNKWPINERPTEYGFVFKNLSIIYPHNILDVGTGTSALPRLMHNCGFNVTAIDNIKDYWKEGMINLHYHVVDDNITNSNLEQRFDVITCISTLEHIEDYSAAIKNIFELLREEGYLILTCPYTEKKYVRNVYELTNSSCDWNPSFICQSFSRTELNQWLTLNNAVIIEQEYYQFWEGNYWHVGKRLIPPIKSSIKELHQLTCLLIKKNS